VPGDKSLIAQRYTRQVAHWGVTNQQQLGQSTVLIAGLGGLGATVSQLLVRAGVGRLYLVDDGSVDGPDLNRQLLYTEADIGRGKLALACERLQSINSEVELIPLDGRIDERFVLPEDLNAVADCLDNYPSRFLLDEHTPHDVYLVHGGLQGESGQVMTLRSGASQPLAKILAGVQQPPGMIPVTPDCVAIVAGLMVNELFAVLFGAPKLLDRCLVISLADFHISFLEV